jgi:LuxR family maltose regulon positive regulatory protein
MPTMPSRLPAGAADTRRGTSVPAQVDMPAQSDHAGEATGAVSPERAAASHSKRRRPRIVVQGAGSALAAHGPARPAEQAGTPLEYPVQLGKVQAPPLRDETLARDRLLDWLSVKIHRRVVLLVAEAGYGKTTLLADFSRRTRVRVLWFRLDRGDRDWVGFIAHLVAAVRIHLPGFGSATAALLRETATSAPSLETVLDTFLRELGGLPNDPTAFVFDDVHLVDDSPDVKLVLRELLARGPERMSFVFASRREPPIRLARLRALGEVAELGTDDLRFDAAETERLFSETYEMRLEPSVLAELSRRTEGWAASLQLVRAALHDRNAAEVRAFISSLSGAEGHLYEYLAEEVVGDLSSELQQFLMRTSLLETVDLKLGPVAAGISEDETRAMIEESERHGLFGRGGQNTRHVVRAHPLVRDFLQARLHRSIGGIGVREINSRIGLAAERFNWQVAARHYLAADREEETQRILAGALDQILATGAYEVAQELASLLTVGGLPDAVSLVLRSRMAQQRAAIHESLDLAEEAWTVAPESNAVLVNLVAARSLAGQLDGAFEAGRLLADSSEEAIAAIGHAYLRAHETSLSGSVPNAVAELERFAQGFRERGESHYLGVSLLNLAYLHMAAGRPELALACADGAVANLTGMELTTARLARSFALAYLGNMTGARAELRAASQDALPGQSLEIALEAGQIEALLGESDFGWLAIAQGVRDAEPSSDNGEQVLYAKALLEARNGDVIGATKDVAHLQLGQPRTAVAFEAQRLLVIGLVHALANDGAASDFVRRGTELAAGQGAAIWERYGAALQALADQDLDPSSVVISVAQTSPVSLSMLAEAVLRRAPDLSASAFQEVNREAGRRPWRWRESARRAVASGSAPHAARAAQILGQIGEAEDIPRLRDASKRLKNHLAPRIALTLSRRLAERVQVDDLGRVRIQLGSRLVEGADVRRKVLALLCLLLSKPGFALTREEVLDSLWPDHDPSSALNSLNQTVYFLRRVFEPSFADETSPGYVGQDGETIWLDSELIDSRSRRCLEIIRSMPGDPTPAGAVALASEYSGRFALDFAYEEWSGPFRDALHASYLRVVEQAVMKDLDSGHFDRGTFLAERAAEVDPDAEEIQIALIRLYRHTGAHAAAAERYESYARAMRDLGIEPPSLADL